MSDEKSPDVVEIETPWITYHEAIRYTHAMSDTLLKAIKGGELRAVHVGRPGRWGWVTRREWCDAWLERHATGGDRVERALSPAPNQPPYNQGRNER